jgi:hypothetical protein
MICSIREIVGRLNLFCLKNIIIIGRFLDYGIYDFSGNCVKMVISSGRVTTLCKQKKALK